MTIFSIPMPHSAIANNGVRRELNRYFNETLQTRAANLTTAAPNGPTAFTPAVDVREDVDGFTISLDLPGVSASAVEVLADDNVITVKGEKRRAELSEGERLISAERAHGAFTRSFRLPKSADVGRIEARFTDGQLDIRVAKTAPVQPRKVEVQVTAA